MFFFIENIQKSFNNWERLPFLMVGILCYPSLLTTPSAENINLVLLYCKKILNCFVVIYSEEGQVGWSTYADFRKTLAHAVLLRCAPTYCSNL